MDYHAITAPEIPDPSSTKAQVDSPTFDNHRASHFNLLNIGVRNRRAEERKRPETNRQAISLVHNGQMVESWPQEETQQTSPEQYPRNHRHVLNNPGNHKKSEGRTVHEQAEWSLLCVRVHFRSTDVPG